MNIQFSTEGAAFQSAHDDSISNIYKRQEIARILKKIVLYVENGNDCGPIMDINGNQIGEWSL